MPDCQFRLVSFRDLPGAAGVPQYEQNALNPCY